MNEDDSLECGAAVASCECREAGDKLDPDNEWRVGETPLSCVVGRSGPERWAVVPVGLHLIHHSSSFHAHG